jgi:hypothetical protein
MAPSWPYPVSPSRQPVRLCRNKWRRPLGHVWQRVRLAFPSWTSQGTNGRRTVPWTVRRSGISPCGPGGWRSFGASCAFWPERPPHASAGGRSKRRTRPPRQAFVPRRRKSGASAGRRTLTVHQPPIFDPRNRQRREEELLCMYGSILEDAHHAKCGSIVGQPCRVETSADFANASRPFTSSLQVGLFRRR